MDQIQMVNKILICIESDNVSSRGGAELKIGEKYHIATIDGWPGNIIGDYKLCRIQQGDNLIGFFSEENIKKYFRSIEEHRNNIIDKIIISSVF
jgi:hypothetical protein